MSELEDNSRLAAQYVLELAKEMGDESFARTIYKAMRFWLPKGPAGRPRATLEDPGAEPDRWRVRLMLFNDSRDLVADTMPGLDLSELPDVGMPTLKSVANYVAATAHSFHGEVGIEGLDEGTLDRRILALRVNLSRSGGDTWWKVPYTFGGRAWQINVKVHRSTESDTAPPPDAPTSHRSSEHRREPPAGSPEELFAHPTD